ncbi:hypothetical protein ACQP1V_31270 [Microtetraspora malaysiensis]|uniref:hypothetical protein n=1 Tax=Microtetraspora malaysiensis TaxID=161358 RepID=UPI003D8BA334
MRVAEERGLHGGRGGDVLVVGAGVAHRFTATGPDRLRMVRIHASPQIGQEFG